MQKLLFMLLFTFLPCAAFTQGQYLETTITTNDGTKKIGKIAAKTWRQSPRAIDFQEGESTHRVYQIADLPSFEIVRPDGTNLRFFRKEVDIEVSNVQQAQLDLVPDLHYKKDTCWLKLVYEGTWKLYSLTDKSNKTHFLLEINDKQPVELVYKPWRRGFSDFSRTERIELFRKQLNEFGLGCEEVQQMLRTADFLTNGGLELKESALVKICKAYDRCKGIAPVYQKKSEKGHFSGHVLAGGHLGSIDLSTYVDKKLKGMTGLHIGLGVEYFIANTNGRISVYNEIIAYKDNQKVQDTYAVPLGYKSEFGYKGMHFVVSNVLAIRITKLSFAPTFRIGFTNRFQFDQKLMWKYAPESQFTTQPAADYTSILRRHELGPSLGVSAAFRRVGLALCYYLSAPTQPGAFFSTKVLALNASYRLF